MKPNSWDVMKYLGESNNKALRLAPMSNVLRVQKVKLGTQVTFGVGEDLVVAVAYGTIVGGFLYCDRDVWRAAETELSAKAEGELVDAKKYSDLRALHESLLTVFGATHALLSAALPYEFWQHGEETQTLRAAYEEAWRNAYPPTEGQADAPGNAETGGGRVDADAKYTGPLCACGVRGVGMEGACHADYYNQCATSSSDGREWCQCCCHWPERTR